MGQCFSGLKKKNEDEVRVSRTLSELFPQFKPLTPTCPAWQKEAGVRCPECTKPLDFLSFKTNCRSCGRIFCSRCCYTRKAIQGEKICGLCMAGAMISFRQRELSNLEGRIQKHHSQHHQRKYEVDHSVYDPSVHGHSEEVELHAVEPSATGSNSGGHVQESHEPIVVQNSLNAKSERPVGDDNLHEA